MRLRGIIHVTWVIILLFLLVGCSSSTGPDLEVEASLIPWGKITGKLAYSRGGGSRLFIINGDEGKLYLIKSLGDGYFYGLTWKYDGSLLTYYYYGYGPGGMGGLYNIKTDGSDPFIVYPQESATNRYPAWSRDGRLAYWASSGYWTQSRQIWIDNEPFFNRERCSPTRPAWTPDANFLVIALLDSTTDGALYRVSLSDTSMSPILQCTQGYMMERFCSPIFSPDGSKLAFCKWGPALGGDDEIWIVNFDGTDPTRITSGHNDRCPAWSPDGTHLAFIRETDIYLVSLDDGELTQVTHKGVVRSLTWIP